MSRNTVAPSLLARVLGSAALLGLAAARPAVAEEYTFTLHNESDYKINGFQTFEDGKWSSWSSFTLAPGQSTPMNWNSDSGECKVPFRIIYKDAETEQYTIDWCKVTNIHVKDDEVYGD